MYIAPLIAKTFKVPDVMSVSYIHSRHTGAYIYRGSLPVGLQLKVFQQLSSGIVTSAADDRAPWMRAC